jgi:hypothetical protein
MITPIDPNELDTYNELMEEDARSSSIEKIYKITGRMKNYINPTAYGELKW